MCYYKLMKQILLSKFKKLSLLTFSFALGLLVFMGMAIVYAWTEPTLAPPNGNVATPVNVSGTTQYKTGAFGVGGVYER